MFTQICVVLEAGVWDKGVSNGVPVNALYADNNSVGSLSRLRPRFTSKPSRREATNIGEKTLDGLKLSD